MKVMIAATSSENYSGASKAFFELCQSLKAEGIDVIAMIPSHVQIEESLKKLLADKDIVCVCSLNEAFGRVTVEGMLSKCLVVASDSGASGEIIQDGVTGRLYINDSVDSLTETILKAINDLYIDNGIPDAAQTFAIKNFSEQLNTENIIKLYKQII